MSKRKGEKTLLLSVLLSAPGPLVVGLGLLVGRSSTQLADFIRRTSEFMALIVSYSLFRVTNRGNITDIDRKLKLEWIANLSVGIAMVLGALAMLVVAIFKKTSEHGNVIPGLVIAILGVVANTLFWLRYRRLNQIEPNRILAVQSRLYRVKALVDLCVTLALLTVVLAPNVMLSYYVDIAGSIVVATYMLINGIQTISGKNKAKDIQEDSRREPRQI